MSATDWVIISYASLFCLVWTVFFSRAIQATVSIPLFEDVTPLPLGNWPGISVVIAACNEEKSIQQATSTLLDQDYPHLEIILVNDRSTDGTGDVIETIARKDGRVKPVHIAHLPSGWLGKVNALHVGTQRSTGDWILYTDADVHFRKGTLRKAMALAQEIQVDHLVLIPVPHANSFWLDVIMQAFGSMFIQGTRAMDVGKPGSDAAVGVGAFNMVKKSALDRTEGFPWFRMDVADDVALGLLLHRSGAKSRLMVTIQDVSLKWYSSVREMFNGLEKNLFGAIAHYSIVKLVLVISFLWAFVLAPIIALSFLKASYLWILGVAAILVFVLSAFIGKNRFRQRLLPTLLIPIGMLVVSLMILRSGVLCVIRGGITWRGTHYKMGELRRGQRVKL